MSTRYKVTLTPEEREQVEAITKRGKHESRMVLLDRALLLCDDDNLSRLRRRQISVKPLACPAGLWRG
jgi:hypothetical protein